MSRILVVLLGLSLLLAQAGQVAGQQPPAPPPSLPTPEPGHRGDVLWAFAQEPPFNDTRVALALATLIDAKVRTGGARVFYAEVRPQIVAYVDRAPAPPDQVPLLLTAAGFPSGLGSLTEVGRCQVWVSPVSTAVPAAVSTLQVAMQLASELPRALSSQGKTVQDCSMTQDVTAADVLVWVQGTGLPGLTPRQQSTFLALPGVAPSAPPSLTPPSTGDGGLAPQASHPALRLSAAPR